MPLFSFGRQPEDADEPDNQLQDQLDLLPPERAPEAPQDDCHAWGMMMAAELRLCGENRRKKLKAKIARLLVEMNEEGPLVS